MLTPQELELFELLEECRRKAGVLSATPSHLTHGYLEITEAISSAQATLIARDGYRAAVAAGQFITHDGRGHGTTFHDKRLRCCGREERELPRGDRVIHWDEQAAEINCPRADATIHFCPPEGQYRTPCCDKTPFELPRGHRLTNDPSLVTCRSARDNAFLAGKLDAYLTAVNADIRS